MRNIFVAACAAIVASFGSVDAASAQEAPWRITEAQGAVRVAQPGQATVEAQLNAPLTAGTTVTTGANSRAVVFNGLQRITVTANSRMTIAADSTPAMTRILQDLGAVFFQVDRRNDQHFRVETPLLAAVVKGTTFTVNVGVGEDTVHVSQGLVEVRATVGGAASDVAAGMTARVAQDAPAAVSMAAPPAEVAEAQETAPGLDYAEASGGLVAGPETLDGGARSAGHANANANANANGPSGNSGNAYGHGSVGVMGAVRNTIAWLTGNAGGNNNGNAGDNGNHGNSNASGNNNGNAGDNSNHGNGNAGDNSSHSGHGNGNDRDNPPPVVPGG